MDETRAAGATSAISARGAINAARGPRGHCAQRMAARATSVMSAASVTGAVKSRSARKAASA
eukprot:4236845-Lingulodinium_polyedra.AAC.1